MVIMYHWDASFISNTHTNLFNQGICILKRLATLLLATKSFDTHIYANTAEYN